MLSYMYALSSNGHRSPRGVLYNLEEWCYFELQSSGQLQSLIRGKWTDFGSRAFLSERVLAAPKGPLTRAVQAVADQLHVKVVGPDPFLGHGLQGYVFKVQLETGRSGAGNESCRGSKRKRTEEQNIFAMKVVLEASIKSEFQKIRAVSALHSDLVCAPHGDLAFDDRWNCGAYLMPLGSPIIPLGDPRLPKRKTERWEKPFSQTVK